MNHLQPKEGVQREEGPVSLQIARLTELYWKEYQTYLSPGHLFNTVPGMDAEETAAIQNVTWGKMRDIFSRRHKTHKNMYDFNRRHFQGAKFGMICFCAVPLEEIKCWEMKKGDVSVLLLVPKSRGCRVQQGDCSWSHVAHVRAAGPARPKSPPHQKKFCSNVWWRVTRMYWGDHFMIYTNPELHCTPETDAMSWQLGLK